MGGRERKGDGGGDTRGRQVDSVTFLPSRFTAAQGPKNRPGAVAKLQSSSAFLRCKHRLAAGARLSARCCLLTNDFLWRAQRLRRDIYRRGQRAELSVLLLLGCFFFFFHLAITRWERLKWFVCLHVWVCVCPCLHFYLQPVASIK